MILNVCRTDYNWRVSLKNKIAIVAYETPIKIHYENQLKDFFGDCVEIKGYSIKELEKKKFNEEKIDADVIVITYPDITNLIGSYYSENAEIVYLMRTFDGETIKKLHCIPKGTQVMLVDYSETTALDTMAILYELGINHLKMHLIYPGIDECYIPNINIAITPGQEKYVPLNAKNVINLGLHLIGVYTYVNIISKLDIMDEELNYKLYKYSTKIISPNEGLMSKIKDIWEIRSQWLTVLDAVDDGIILLDKNGMMLTYNIAVMKLLGTNGYESYNGKKYDADVFEKLCMPVINVSEMDNEFVEIEGVNKNVIYTKRVIKWFDTVYGFLIIIKDVTQIQKLENNLRIQLASRGHQAKYYFTDIVYESEAMKDCIDRAKKISKINSNILITGDSGTGKELFAQSIHNNSARKNKPFVAINCAALPVDLLESELFGYEEGAFTGAKKGGKKGLFELAHNGTIFLDEIGDLPLNVQAKLLRVLQEKEVMQIGSSSLIPIDVRIIAATNCNLKEVVNENKFRKDLYYRLNNLRLHVPPLKDRKEDIKKLIDYFIAHSEYKNKKINEQLYLFLIDSKWEGNVRELKGCIESMLSLGDDVLTIKDLPYDYQADINLTTETNFIENKTDANDTSQYFFPNEMIIVNQIIRIFKIRPMGRRRMVEQLKNEGIHTTEYKVRKIIDKMYELNLIEYGKGKKPTRRPLTPDKNHN